MKITVVGSGGWGTALALLLLENGHDVTLWSYHEAECSELRENREKLEKLSRHLYEKETITGEEFMELMKE